MKTIQVLSFFTLFVAVTVSHSVFAEDLPRDEVLKLFSGKTVEAYHVKKDFDIKTYFNTDGTYRQFRDGEPRAGKWWVKDDGKMCMQRSDRNREYCRIIVKAGDKLTKVKVKENGKRVHLLDYKKFTEGDAL